MYELRIDGEYRLVVTKWGSEITDEAILAYQREVWSDPALSGFSEVMDFRQVREPRVTSEGLKALAREAVSMDESTGHGKTAIVVEETFSFGMARMYEAWRSSEKESRRDTRVFRDLDEAMLWVKGT